MGVGEHGQGIVANLLTHALVAMALHAAAWSWITGRPLTDSSFLAALVALLPDIDLELESERSPLGHSLGYSLVWVLCSLSGLTFAASLGFIVPSSIVPYSTAIVAGMGSHLFLDSLVEPGIFLLRRSGTWIVLKPLTHLRPSALEPALSVASVAGLLGLLAFY